LIITGITALIGLGTLLYKNFEPFKNLIDGIMGSVGSVVSSIGGFLGFGDDEDEKKKPSNNTSYKVGATVKKVATATAISSQLVAAQPNINYTKLPTPKQASAKQEVSQSITINFGDIKLDIKDGKIPQDLQAQIESSVKKALAKTKSNRGLSDEDI
jgi:hypothetical protein